MSKVGPFTTEQYENQFTVVGPDGKTIRMFDHEQVAKAEVQILNSAYRLGIATLHEPLTILVKLVRPIAEDENGEFRSIAAIMMTRVAGKWMRALQVHVTKCEDMLQGED